MPLYEYQCQQCAKKTEVLQRYEDPPPASCPACGGEVKKMISSPAFQFKGSGWYVTDYAKKGAGSEAKDGSGPDAKPAGPDDAGSSASAAVPAAAAGGGSSEKAATPASAKPAAGGKTGSSSD